MGQRCVPPQLWYHYQQLKGGSGGCPDQISTTEQIPSSNTKVCLKPEENTKVSSIAQGIIYATTNGMHKTPKSVVLSMALRKVSGSKTLMKILGRFGHTMSYGQVINLEKLLEMRHLSEKGRGILLPSNIKSNILGLGLGQSTGMNTSYRTKGIMTPSSIRQDSFHFM